jgi:small subunit ribosomal protein S2
MPYVVERWPGGMLTNFTTIRKAVKKMINIDRMLKDPSFTSISKRERLQITRERAKLEKNLGSIADLTKLPSALFVVDITKEHIAVAEAQILGIPTFAIVDTNSDPKKVDFPIPGNDDAGKSISIIIQEIVDCINEGLTERKMSKEVDEVEEEEVIDERKEIAIDDEDEVSEKPKRKHSSPGKSGKGGNRKINIEVKD